MAVLIEGISVVFKVEALRSRYPGGWQGFVADVPNKTLCADGELVRLGFMTPVDVEEYVVRMATHELAYLCDGRAEDLVVADQRRGLAAPCKWAEFGHVNLCGDLSKQVAVCRAINSQSLEVVTPDGWEYGQSLSSQYLFVENGWAPEFMDFLRHEDGLDVYRDLRTNRVVYVGRVPPR